MQKYLPQLLVYSPKGTAFSLSPAMVPWSITHTLQRFWLLELYLQLCALQGPPGRASLAPALHSGSSRHAAMQVNISP